MIINIIVAYCNNNGIGKDNALVWNIKSDMAKFKKLTIGNANNAVIMGKNTFLSISSKLFSGLGVNVSHFAFSGAGGLLVGSAGLVVAAPAGTRAGGVVV